MITGCSSGIGAALARHYAKPGVRLSLLGRDAARTAAITRLCREAGSEAGCVTGDVTDAAFMQDWLLGLDRQWPVDTLIANAGIGGAAAEAGQAGERIDAATAIFATNVGGVINTVVPLLPWFVARASGHVVLMGSLAGLVALPQFPVYSASKAAVRTYGEGLRRLLAPSGVHVTIVSPGYIDTPMSRSLRSARPLLWDADRAARKIAKGIARRDREIAFPWPLWIAAKIAQVMPAAMLDRLLAQRGGRSRT